MLAWEIGVVMTCRADVFLQEVSKSLPFVRLTGLNNVSATAWRYAYEERLCLIIVSSGLADEVFNANLNTLDRLQLDTTVIGGEMSHMAVEPRAVATLVQHTKSQAKARPDDFKASKLVALFNGDIERTNTRYLSMTAKEDDDFTLRLIEYSNQGSCGNIFDLCSYY
jgi:hypothetical protein